jgi:protein phosphatase
MGVPTNKNATKVEILIAESQDIGYGAQRNRLEDRCAGQQITTAGGLELYLGVVADGVGGNGAGEVASTLAVDTILDHVKNSRESDVHLLLGKAVNAAHQAVRDRATQNHALRAMGTTATVAAIHDGQLYLAHVGDSRAYLARGEKAIQLTLDHSWGNEMIRLGRFTPEETATHPKRDDLGRYLGQPPQLPLDVDLGYRLLDSLPPGTHPAKSELKREGLPLQQGDVVLLCTDGLIKQRHRQPGHFVETEEIASVVQRKKNHPKDTANTLISLALGRQTDDNVSVVVMEVPGPKTGIGWSIPGKPGMAARAVVAGVLGVCLLATLALAISKVRPPKPTPTATTFLAISTSIPTFTLAPTMPPRGIATVIEVEGAVYYTLPDTTGGLVKPGWEVPDTREIALRSGGDGKLVLELRDGSWVYLGTNTGVVVEKMAGPGSESDKTVLLLEKGNVLVKSPNLEVRAEAEDGFSAQARGALMGVIYEPTYEQFDVDCLRGECLALIAGRPIDLEEGQGTGWDANGEVGGARHYEVWAALGGADVPAPTPTPEITPTPLPTETPTAPPKPTKVFIPPTATDTREPPRRPTDTPVTPEPP